MFFLINMTDEKFLSFLIFLLNVLGWLWIIKLYRFQVYSSMIHHPHIVLCVHHPKSSLLVREMDSGLKNGHSLRGRK